jgi:hypothetical protein
LLQFNQPDDVRHHVQRWKNVLALLLVDADVPLPSTPNHELD